MGESFEDVCKREELRYRIVRILRSQECFKIRFKLVNVSIEPWMWPGLANAIETGTWCKVRIGDGDDFDFPNTFHFATARPERFEIVHEVTHMMIWATHVGKTIQTGVHEAAAYLAEALFTLYSGDQDNLNTQPHLAYPLFQLATSVKNNTRIGRPSVVCDPTSVMNIIAILTSLLHFLTAQEGGADAWFSGTIESAQEPIEPVARRPLRWITLPTASTAC